jgi:Cytidine and deoxycytidylate deaminase zinc-binding region
MSSGQLPPVTGGTMPATAVEQFLCTSGMTVEQLMLALIPQAQSAAIPPISKFFVGAIALGASGSIYFGANYEFVGQALSFTVHAEQAATAHAISSCSGTPYLVYSPCVPANTTWRLHRHRIPGLIWIELHHRFRQLSGVLPEVLLEEAANASRITGATAFRGHRSASSAPKVKSGSRCVRFVIAKHSPERALETGLPMEPLEKNLCNGSDVARRPFSLVRFIEEIPRKVGLFRMFQQQWGHYFSAVETAWRREVNSNCWYAFRT